MSASRRPLPDTPEPWLRSALKNRLLNQAREQRRRAAREENSGPGAAPDSPEELLARLEMHKRLVEAVARLAEPYRQTVLLRYFEELTSSEIGERLNLPAATVRGRLKTAIDLLREDLDRAPGGRKGWVGAMVLLAGGGRLAPEMVGAAAKLAAGGSSLTVKLVVALAVVGGAGTVVVRATRRPEAPAPVARQAPLPPARFERLAPPEPPVRPETTPAAAAVAPAAPQNRPLVPLVPGSPNSYAFTGWAQLGETRPQPTRFDSSQDPSCPPQRDEEVVAANDGSLANVVVRVTGATVAAEAPPAPLVIEQRDCQYHPRIAVARVGQAIQLRSADQVLHQAHVYGGNGTGATGPLSMGTPTIELAGPRAGETVRIGCDEHPWMTATIVGADSPWFAVTDHRGRFTVAGLPAGAYNVEAWHERYGPQRTQVTVGPGRALGVLNFVFGKEWQPPGGESNGRGWPVAADGKCQIAIKGDSPVVKACAEGGIKKAKAVMKGLQRLGKGKGLKFECDECHKDESAGNWTLKPWATEKFRELLRVVR